MSKKKVETITAELTKDEYDNLMKTRELVRKNNLVSQFMQRLRQQRIGSSNISTILLSLPIPVLEQFLEVYNPVPTAPVAPQPQARLVNPFE